FHVTAQTIIHPGPTVGYRVAAAGCAVAYLPDHEPALGALRFPQSPTWTSGHALCDGVDLLIHDAQYSPAEYEAHVGWGHSATTHAVALATQARVRHLKLFHHDPLHADAVVDQLALEAVRHAGPGLAVSAAREGEVFMV